MYFIALRMLMGDTAKYVALIVGLAFSTTLVVQQGSIASGVLKRLSISVSLVPQAEIWVMHPSTRYFEERRPLPDPTLQQVRGVEGVEWAVPYYVGAGTARLPDGSFAGILITGVDRHSKVGLPSEFESGSADLIDMPDAVIWDNLNLALYKKVKVGDILEINDRRARIVGLAKAPRTFLNQPVIYTTYERALRYSPGERKRLTFILAKVKPGLNAEVVAARIRERTGQGALTSSQFTWATVDFFLKNSGIPINFGITVLLGLIVGIAVAGQTFYTFTVENLKHFATLKAMGLSTGTLNRMVMMQALLVGLIGWGLGVGAAALFGSQITDRSPIAFWLTPHLLAFSFVSMMGTVLLAAWISIRRLKKAEPAMVFR